MQDGSYMTWIGWEVYVISIALHWYKRWLVVRDWSRRPNLFMEPGPSGILIFLGWISMIGALVMIARSYSIWIAIVVGVCTGVFLNILSRHYFIKEVEFWTDYYVKKGIAADEARDPLLTSIISSMKLTPEQSSRYAREFSVELVKQIRRSPDGKGYSL